MKATKPNKKDFTKPFILDNNLVVFKAKEYLKELEPYCNELEQINKELLEALKRCDNLFGIIQKKEGLGNDNLRFQVKKAINQAL